MRNPTLLLAIVLAAGTAAAQEQAPAAAPASEPRWTYSLSAYTYHVDEDHDYVQPTLLLDRGPLHFEARWNYEGLDTGSLWAGWNFAFGDELSVEITPMLGAVMGETNGVAPGYRGALGWRMFEFTSEGEYLFDSEDSDDNFFFTWSELTWSPTDWLRLGGVVQRTRTYQTDLDTQRGFLLGLTFKRINVTAYWFNPDQSELTAVVGIGFNF